MIMTIEANSVRGMGALAAMPCPPPLNSRLWSLRFVDVERPFLSDG